VTAADAERGHGPGTVLGASVVALGVLGLAVPPILARWRLSPDSVEYLGIAHAWVTGRGWLDPVQYAYGLDTGGPPLPGLAVRAPVVSLVAALPMALGASLTGVALAHAVWAACIAGAGVAVARRMMALPAAIGFGIAVGWSFAWVVIATEQVLTEATATGVLLLAVAAAPRAARSAGAAVGLGALVVVGWLTRPNLIVLAPAFALAVLVALGPRRALRSAPWWSFAGAVALGVVGVTVACRLRTGFAPYASYAWTLERLSELEAILYTRSSVGVWSFVRANPTKVLGAFLLNVRGVVRETCLEPGFHYVGWIALPALGHGLWGHGSEGLRRRFTALTALALLAVVLLSYGSHDPRRLPLLAVVCIWLLALAMLDAAARALARAPGPAGARRPAARLLPLAAALALFALAPSGRGLLSVAATDWQAYRRQGTQPTGSRWDRTARAFCSSLDPDARVAAPDPWAFFLWCGTASLRLPPDLSSEAWVARYLDDLAPAYVVLDADPAFASLARSPRLERIASQGRAVLYRVRGAPPRSRPWRAPPPLASLGRARER
jgi:hypothetical protein